MDNQQHPTGPPSFRKQPSEQPSQQPGASQFEQPPNTQQPNTQQPYPQPPYPQPSNGYPPPPPPPYGYSQPPYGYPPQPGYPPPVAKPIGWFIVNWLFCWPLAIYSLLAHWVNIDRAAYFGDLASAQAHARSVRTLGIIALCVGLGLSVLFLITEVAVVSATTGG